MVGNIRFLIYFVVLLFNNYAEGYSRIDPLVDTKVGLIRGLRAADGDYSMFLGIPFGKVDEENPFGASTPYPPFEAEYEANDDSAICPQFEEINDELVGTLDCLHLNIFVPNKASSENRLPVLVWIYGGGFIRGYSGRTLYDPKFLVKHDVVVVTLNYRVGPYGFMCLGTPEVPGNQGFKDQYLALRWIQDNIQSFGGDVNQITLMGESGGAYSVGAHLISGHEKLFNRAILQSGTPFLPGYSQDADPAALLRLADALGFSTDDMSKALSFLAKTDPLLIIATSSQIDTYYPCVEKEFENVEAFITEAPINLKVPKVKGMPVLIGHTADEWIPMHANQKPEYYETFNNFYKSLSDVFTFNEEELVEMETIVRHFYIGDEKISHDVRLKLSDFDSDFMFLHPNERTIDLYLDNGADKIFYYMFSYLGGRNWWSRRNNVTIGGAAHADEIGYLFDVSVWKEEPTTPEDQLMIDRITTLWTNFAKYGDPTPVTTELLPTKWDPITSKDSPRHYMDIDSELTMGMRPYHDRTAFWDLFYEMNKKFQKGYKNDN